VASPQISSRAASVMRRRVVAIVLVVLSLVLLTIYFRESSSGGLHSVQSAGSAVLRPFEVAATRVAQPFRDAASWVGSLASAKSDRDRYKRQVEDLRKKLIQERADRQRLAELERELHYVQGPSFPQGYDALPTTILTRPSGQFDQTVVVDVGQDDGVVANAPVVTPAGLVGQVTTRYSHVARVILLTDPESAVSVRDLNTGASGLLHRNDPGSSIVMDDVPKSQNVYPGDTIVTAGWREGKLASLFPPDIAVGVVNNVSQIDTDPYKHIGVKPFVDFGNLGSVIVLKKRPGKS